MKNTRMMEEGNDELDRAAVSRWAKQIGSRGGKKRAENLGDRLSAVMTDVSQSRALKYPRCPCQKNTLHRAAILCFRCCKDARITSDVIEQAKDEHSKTYPKHTSR